MSKQGPGVGVIGLGFMGATHLKAWARAAADGYPNHLVAVCDRDQARREGGVGVGPGGDLRWDLERSTVALYTEASELLADPAVEIVSITTPTDSHVPLALAALAAGKHVLVEKPVALEIAAVTELRLAADHAATLCMPAQCIRFWPGWDWLIARVDDDGLGSLIQLHIQRLASRPHWGDGFYADIRRCGGVIYDLHVHDADLIRRLAGEPSSVKAASREGCITVDYAFSERPGHITAEASWARDPGQPFFMGFEAHFEGGRASWSSCGGSSLRLEIDGRQEPLTLPALTGYDGQARHLLSVLSGRSPSLEVTMADAVASTRLLAAVSESLESGRLVSL